MEQIQDHALETMNDHESVSIEDTLWWCVGRKYLIKTYMERATSGLGKVTIIDIGTGSGGNLAVLGLFGNVFGVEPSATLARRARNRGVAQTIFEQEVFEIPELQNARIFTMFDVLEHIEGDTKFLYQLKQAARQKHRLLLSVPACPFLWGDHDRILHHHRRYTAKTLQHVIEASGYSVMHMSHFMFFLFPIVILARLRDNILRKVKGNTRNIELGDLPPILSIPFATTLRWEAFLSCRGLKFPIGLWLFALCE